MLPRLISRTLLKYFHRSFSSNFPTVFYPRRLICMEYTSYDLLDLHRTYTTRQRDLSSAITFKNDTDSSAKSRLISEMNFETSSDAIPFTKLPMSTLLHIHRVTRNDVKHGYCKNRLYYIAEHIKVPPSVLSERITRRIFIYSLSFDWVASALKVLLEMEVPGDRVLRDLWVLKYHKDTIRERLQRVKDAGIDRLYPWMVRCSEDILDRYIRLSKETKDILGDTKTTKVYLSDRLNITLQEVDGMCYKIPALKTIRVTKVKSFLDFLEKEGFTVEDIANKSRILTSSQKTIQHRLEKLRSLGLTDINLNVLCRSRKHFKRYVETLESSNSE